MDVIRAGAKYCFDCVVKRCRLFIHACLYPLPVEGKRIPIVRYYAGARRQMCFQERFHWCGDETRRARELCWQRFVRLGIPREQGGVAQSWQGTVRTSGVVIAFLNVGAFYDMLLYSKFCRSRECLQQVRSYGDLFREGDTVGVTLDMDAGTLEFFLNGVSLGVAVEVCLPCALLNLRLIKQPLSFPIVCSSPDSPSCTNHLMIIGTRD